jgi:polyphenol oxidase
MIVKEHTIGPQFGEPSISAAFPSIETSHGRLNMLLSLRNAGDMGPSYDFSNKRRAHFFDIHGIDPGCVTGLTQVHSQSVYYAQDSRSVSGREGDGLFTDNPKIILAVTVADCLPIFLADRVGGSFGVVHSGWKGTGIVLTALEKLAQLSGSSIDTVIGPGIGSCCYSVDEKRARLFQRNYGPDSVTPSEPPRLDLRAANLLLLSRAKRKIGTVTVTTNCTACTPFLGSFRREGPKQFTRMIALIGYF